MTTPARLSDAEIWKEWREAMRDTAPDDDQSILDFAHRIIRRAILPEGYVSFPTALLGDVIVPLEVLASGEKIPEISPELYAEINRAVAGLRAFAAAPEVPR